ncbi:hypothetical protein DRN84_02960 [Candidatus Geothermarchaeota archaeon]|nr:MAG: hypothetical protein DRN84_02960 [Candidatus Geothermarchaeota archaeon]
MVTNLPEAAKAQWKRVVAARTPEEKLEELRKFYSMIPKHKGTKNLVKQVRRQMARLREEVDERRRRKAGVYRSRWSEEKHGVARVAILSEDQFLGENIFRKLSGRDVEDSLRWSYEPIYGVFSYDSIQFQLTLLPPYNISDSLDHRIYTYIKSSVDYILVSGYNVDDVNRFLSQLSEDGLYIGCGYGEIYIEKTPTGGVRIVNNPGLRYDEVINLLRSYRIYNAIVKFDGEVSLSDIEDYILGIRTVKPGSAILCEGECIIYRICRGRICGELGPLDNISAGKEVLDGLGLIRVYTRPHGGDILDKPVILKKNSRVIDLAREIHSRLYKNFRYAVIERGGKRIRASKNFRLEDGDIVTIYA